MGLLEAFHVSGNQSHCWTCPRNSHLQMHSRERVQLLQQETVVFIYCSRSLAAEQFWRKLVGYDTELYLVVIWLNATVM